MARFRGDPQARGAPLTRPQLIAKVLPIEKRFFALAARHVNATDDDVSNLARALFVHHPHFFTFVHDEGVDPTNNVAERALRTAVVWGSSAARFSLNCRSAAPMLAQQQLIVTHRGLLIDSRR